MPVKPEVEFTVHDTIEYFYDQDVKARIVCSVDCELPVDTVWWHLGEEPSADDFHLMSEENGKFVYIFQRPYAGLKLKCFYRLSIGGWRYNSDTYWWQVNESDLDSIVP